MLTRNLTILASVIVLVSCFLLLMMSTITPGKNQAFARCPNGTHISPSGDCETVIPHAGLLRCPNGFHMSPSGNCEQVEPSTSGADSGNLNTVPSPTQNTSPSPPPSSSTSQFTGNFGTDVMPPETFITSVIDGSNSTLIGQGQVQQQTGPIGNNNTSSSLSSNPPSNTNTTSHSSKMMFTFAGTDNIAIAGFECSLDRPLQSPNSAPSALDAFASRVFSCSNRVVIDGLVPWTYAYI